MAKGSFRDKSLRNPIIGLLYIQDITEIEIA